MLANPGRSYIAYADNLTGKLGVKELPAGRCEVTWLDCKTGKTMTERQQLARSGDHAFSKPDQVGQEGVCWIRFPEIKLSRRGTGGSVSDTKSPGQRKNQPPVAKDQQVATRSGAKLYIQLEFTDADGPGPYSYSIVRSPAHGTLAGDNNDRFYTPAAGFTGTDRFTWKVNDGQADSRVATVAITVTKRTDRAQAKGDYFPSPEPAGGWRKLDKPEDIRRLAGMDLAKLAQLKERLLASDKRNFAAVVIRNGYTVLEVERGNSSRTYTWNVKACGKAICASSSPSFERCMKDIREKLESVQS